MTTTIANTIATLRAPETSVPGLLALWLRRLRTRAALAQLSEERLADIGLSAEQAAAEAAKPFWRG